MKRMVLRKTMTRLDFTNLFHRNVGGVRVGFHKLVTGSILWGGRGVEEMSRVSIARD